MLDHEGYELGGMAGEIEKQRGDRLVDLHRDPIPGHEARAAQEGRESRGLALEITVGEARAIGRLGEQRVGIGGKPRPKQVEEVAVMHDRVQGSLARRNRRTRHVLTCSPKPVWSRR